MTNKNKQTTPKNQKFITCFFVKEQKKDVCFGYNDKTKSWHCSQCGIDMGINNPRQLCGKIRCTNIFSI